MFAYYLRLGIASLKRHPALSALMILAIAIGIGVCMTTLTVHTLMSADPIPWKSDKLFAVRLDSWGAEGPWEEPNEPPPELTWRDATALMRSDIPVRHAAMFKGLFTLQTEDPAFAPYMVHARISHKDFFALFDLPFRFGGGWGASADENLEQVVVLGQKANEKLFGGENSVGRSIKIDEKDFKVIGVLERWEPLPKFYDVNNGSFDEPEDIFLPWGIVTPLQVRTAGNTNGWSPEVIDSFASFLNSESVWIQFWAELPDAQSKARYQAFLDAYVGEQKKLGRFARPLNNRLSDVNQFMQERRVVGEDSKVLLGLSFLFLAVCLINMVGLLLAKFLGKAPELALRRALGASQWQIVALNLVEVSLVGLLGGALGLAFAFGGLELLKALYGDAENLRLYALNLPLALEAIAIALLASLLAGLYPAWKVGRQAPAGLLKTQ